jgi:cob(I)alamin adenosyltransferase
LFQLGAELATVAAEHLAKLDRIADADVAALEGWIDRLDAELPALKNFVLPGGSALAAELHRARTVCRRAERRLIALRQEETIEPRLVAYLNRLADLLFVMARWCNHRAGIGEIEWKGRAR